MKFPEDVVEVQVYATLGRLHVKFGVFVSRKNYISLIDLLVVVNLFLRQ